MHRDERHPDTTPPTTETPTQLIGVWQLSVTFADGPLQGQVEISRLFFAPDHTCLILLPYPGAGTWQAERSGAFSFNFTELLEYRAEGTYAGYAIVTGESESLSLDGASFTASGQGEVYSANGIHLATNTTTAQANRIRHTDSTSV
jgi:hypothetical protein